MLRQAKERKQQQASMNGVPMTPSMSSSNSNYDSDSDNSMSLTDQESVPSQQQAWQRTEEPKSAREKAAFKSKVPFSEDLYTVLKKSIELLSIRVRNERKLTKEEAVWFGDAIDVIMDDARRYGPPPKPERVDEPQM